MTAFRPLGRQHKDYKTLGLMAQRLFDRNGINYRVGDRVAEQYAARAADLLNLMLSELLEGEGKNEQA